MGETESILLRTFSKVGKNVFLEKETFYKWKVRPERTNSVAVRERGKMSKANIKNWSENSRQANNNKNIHCGSSDGEKCN